ncbi:MAG TPA: ABC transporter permease, partial [Gammaproteobacteria bacterium]|nr:ABC transporter permease [Gammaproteobacteria bacterium]
MLRLEPRPQASQQMALLAPLLAILLTLIAGAFLFSAWGANPLTAMYTFFIEPVNSVYGFTELLLKATPLVLTGIGLAICFRANIWNIGAEGQLTAG